MKKIVPPITHLVCKSCSTKNSRPYEEDDYVFKDTGECPKCQGTMMITGIYIEDRQLKKKK